MDSDICQSAGNDCIQIAKAENLFCSVPSPTPPSARYQLPRDITDFTGRREQIEEAKLLIDPETRIDRTAPVILAIYGMPGVGKSTFAIHLAHLLKKSFSYAQLYADLRGADGHYKNPHDILANFLRVLGVEEQFIPADLESRASLFRSQLDNKQALILLDNVYNAGQVRPLLPGSPMCAAVITSRSSLSALEGAIPRDLDLLPEDDAVEFLRHLLGNDRIQSELEAAKQIVNLCGYLPLAIRIAGGTLRDKQHWTLKYYVDRLTDERKRLEQLKLDDLDVRSSFLISYRELGPIDARLFRLLSALNVSDFPAEIASSVLDIRREDALDAVEMLVKVQLLEPVNETRYRFHDLIHLFARELLEKKDKPRVRSAARLRVTKWYVEQSTAMSRLFHPEDRREIARTFSTETEKSLIDIEKICLQNAINWFELEHKNITALIESATSLAECKLVWRLAFSIFSYLDMRAFWMDMIYINKKALEAIKKVGNLYGESIILNNLGNGYRLYGRLEDALQCLEQALALNIRLEDHHYEGTLLMNIGSVYYLQHKYSDAIKKYEESLAIRRELKDPYGESQTLIGLGLVYKDLGQYDKAIELFNESISISKILGDLYNESLAIRNLGNAYSENGQLNDALLCYERDLAISRELGNRHVESGALHSLGNLYKLKGEPDKAIAIYEEGISIKREIGYHPGDGKIFNSLGEIYAKQYMWNKAIENCEEGLRIERELGNRYGEGIMLVNLGIIHYRQHLWPEALRRYEEALSIFYDQGDSYGEGMCLANIGAVYRDCSEMDKAIIAWRDALKKLPVSSKEYRKVNGWLNLSQSKPS